MTMLDLYHRTCGACADEIRRTKRMVSKEADGSLYFSDRIEGQAMGYGEDVVHVRVDSAFCELDDEFPDGERHYRVRQSDLQSYHFVG